MNQTPRALNRVLIGLGGIILAALGALALLALWLPAIQELWQRTVDTVMSWTPHQNSGVNRELFWISVAILTLVVSIAMIAWIASQGRGRTNELHSDDAAETFPGVVNFSAHIAEQLLKPAITDLPEVARASISVWIFKKQPCLRVSVTPHSGVSPSLLSEKITQLVHHLDRELGVQVPVLIAIGRPKDSSSSGRVLR